MDLFEGDKNGKSRFKRKQAIRLLSNYSTMWARQVKTLWHIQFSGNLTFSFGGKNSMRHRQEFFSKVHAVVHKCAQDLRVVLNEAFVNLAIFETKLKRFKIKLRQINVLFSITLRTTSFKVLSSISTSPFSFGCGHCQRTEIIRGISNFFAKNQGCGHYQGEDIIKGFTVFHISSGLITV